MSEKLNLKFVFFGTNEFAVRVLEELKRSGLLPRLIITTPDQPKGRGLLLTPPPVKIWASQQNVELLQPEKLDGELTKKLKAISYKLFIVASYGKIIPQKILELPAHGTLNIHPSLLPRHRGPSPIQTTILKGDNKTGVTIMLCDEKIDHGPILKAKSYKLQAKSYLELRDELAKLGAQLLAEVIPDWIAGKIKPVPQPQDDTQATYTKKILKEDGEIKLTDDPELNFRKFRALTPWPGIYFFIPTGPVRNKVSNGAGERVKITKAHLDNGQFVIDRVIPEGKREMTYGDFLRGRNKSR